MSDMRQRLETAAGRTRIVRRRTRDLFTFGATKLPYLLLTPSTLNPDDTVLRTGDIAVGRPDIYIAGDPPQFEGFDLGEEPPSPIEVKLAMLRWVSFPPAKFRNEQQQIEIVEGSLESAIATHAQRLENEDDDETGLLTGVDDLWAYSLILYVGELITRSLPGNVSEFMEHRLARGG